MKLLSKRAAIKLIADFEAAVREHEMIGAQYSDDREGIHRRYDFEHTRLLTKLTQE